MSNIILSRVVVGILLLTALNLKCPCLSFCSKPELSILANRKLLDQLRLEPVVDAGMVQFCRPGPVMEGAEDLGILLGDTLTAAQQEASAARAVLLQCPAIRAVVGVLSQGVGEQQREGDQGEPHDESGE